MKCFAQPPQSLFANSGIQFIDQSCVIDPSHPKTAFIRTSTNGPLCEVTPNEKGHFQYREYAGGPVEWVRPEYRFSFSESLTLLQHQWLPLPYFSAQGARPLNWARIYVSRCRQAKQGWKFTLAFDTQIADDESGLQPSQFDVQQGQIFTLPQQPERWREFFQQTWVNVWMTALYPVVGQAPSFIWQAHYINLLKLLVNQVKPRPLLLQDTAQHSAPVAVDAIIDLGNSNSCGVLFEVDAHCVSPLSLSSELQLRDLSCPTREAYTLFSSELNFSPEPFGHRGFSSASGRMDAFQWCSLVRIGPEAQRLNAQSHRDLQPQGISCPRRYIWDDHSANVIWFNASQSDQAQYSTIDHPLSLMLNDQGILLDELSSGWQFPVFKPQFARSALFTFLIMELVNQIAMQINSLSYRQRHANRDTPRFIRKLIFTLPVNFTTLERQRFLRLAQRAIRLIKTAQPQFFPVNRQDITIEFPWDEACCGQIFWLWQKLRTQSAFDLQKYYHRSPQTSHLRIGLIDVGGGTTDVAVTEYPLITSELSAAPALSPQLLLRQGFTLAGDSLLEDVINHFLLPQFGDHLHQQGLSPVMTILERLFSREKSDDGDSVWRQYVVRHLFLPIVDDVLWLYRLQETAYFCRVSQLIDHQVLGYIEESLNEKIAYITPKMAVCEIKTFTLQFLFKDFIDFLQSPQCRLGQLLTIICDTVTTNQCDVVLLSGQVMELPLFQQRFRANSPYCCLLTELPTDVALPFCSTGRLSNGKHATSLGGLLYSLAMEQISVNPSILPGKISDIPVQRWYGPLREDGRLSHVLLSPPCHSRQRTFITITQPTAMGYRCREEDFIIASPLFALIPNRHKINQLALGIIIELEWHFDRQGELVALPRVISIEDSQRQKVDPQWLQIELNTLSFRGNSQEYYWRDDGRVMPPIT